MYRCMGILFMFLLFLVAIVVMLYGFSTEWWHLEDASDQKLVRCGIVYIYVCSQNNDDEYNLQMAV